jgi:hypothetical protein
MRCEFVFDTVAGDFIQLCIDGPAIDRGSDIPLFSTE